MIAPPPHDASQVARVAVADYAEVGVSAVGKVRCRRATRTITSCLADVNGHGVWRLLVSLDKHGYYYVEGWVHSGFDG
jgi:hypothetical protein